MERVKTELNSIFTGKVREYIDLTTRVGVSKAPGVSAIRKIKSASLAALALAMPAAVALTPSGTGAQAATDTWQGTGSTPAANAWETPGNWTSGVPITQPTR